MLIFKKLTGTAFALLTLLLLVQAKPVQAQEPAYLHALSDLRSARAYLEYDKRPAWAGHRQHAIEQIDKAIDEIKVAAMDDGKNPWHTPPPQSGGSEGWPIHSAVKLLREARHDVDHGFDRPANRGLRERSVEHIDHALHELEPGL
ncbi:MAG: hypothetical protein ABR976_17870 [Terracidiphilus sp.]|jgi:hypothetical protein